MRERLPHSNKRHGPTDGSPSAAKKKAKSQRQPNHSSKKKGMVGAKHRRAVGIGVVKEMAIVGHAQAAGAYYAAGNSCEQAVFAAYAGEMGLSMVGALQAAPRRKDRGTNCGAYRAGVAVLSKLVQVRDQSTKQDDEKNVVDGQSVDDEAGVDAKPVDDKPEADGDEIKKDFRELFEEVFGSLECAEIQTGRKDCLDVITTTARIVDQVLSRHGL